MKYKKISELTEVITGGTPSTTKDEYWDNGNIPWLQSGCCQNCDVNSTEKYITKLGYDNSSTKLMPINTVMIALTGATAGKIGYLNFEACGNQSITGILPCSELNQRYLYYYLISRRQKILSDCIGGAQPHISQGYVKDMIIPVPSLREQDEIVNILSCIDKLISLKHSEIEKLDELVKSRFVEQFGNPTETSSKFKKYIWEELTDFITYGLTIRPVYADKGIPLISARELKGGKIDYSSAPKISEDDYKKLSDKTKPDTTEIFMSKTGTIGTAALFEGTVKIAITQNVARIHLKDFINKKWFIEYLNNYDMHNHLVSLAKGNTVKDFQIQDMKKVICYLPPMKLQNEFAEFVEKVDKSKFKIQQSLDKTQMLFDSLMQQYFG